LKLDQASYRELEAFSKFGSDLDAATKAVLDKGARNVEILKQAQNSPMNVGEQVAIIYLGSKGLLQAVPVNQIKKFEVEFLEFMRSAHQTTLDALSNGKYTKAETDVLEKVAADMTSNY
jgi:F-type H+-transporting ATPase subunit alpha